jgi:hypothetical protein
MVHQSWIENFFDFFVSYEEIRYGAAIAVVLFHADGQRFYATQYEPAFERGHDRPGGFLQEGQFVGVFLIGADHDTTQAIAVAV